MARAGGALPNERLSDISTVVVPTDAATKRYTSVLAPPGLSDGASVVRSPRCASTLGSTTVGTHRNPVPALLASLKVTVAPRAMSNDFPSSSACTTVSSVAGAAVPEGATVGGPAL